jgi:hypothetical protein
MDVLDGLTRDAAAAHRGEAILAHLLLPHYPYVYDAQCRPRRPSDWQERLEHDDVPEGAVNTTATRASKYAEYEAQDTCVMRKLQRLFDTLPADVRQDAIIIVQGDHGSRISLVEPRSADAHLSPADYLDSFSTLFAVRAPSLAPGYDRRIAPITCLLGTFVTRDFRDFEGLDGCAARPTVFMSDGERMVPARFAAFDERGAGEPAVHAAAAGASRAPAVVLSAR